MSFNRVVSFHGASLLRGGIRFLVALLFGALFANSSTSNEMAHVEVKKRVVVFGDSLTAGYLLPVESSFPVVLEQYLKKRGLLVEVINASVSGDTATAGLERLEWSLGNGAHLVILELGANDMLRGINTKVTYGALDSILAKLREQQIPVLLAGMKASRGLGAEYRDDFESIYPNLAAKYGVMLYPFFLEGIAERREFNLSDGIHPNARGVQEVVDRIGPIVADMLRKPVE
jgi:acyl-CoA thioesterase-1